MRFHENSDLSWFGTGVEPKTITFGWPKNEIDQSNKIVFGVGFLCFVGTLYTHEHNLTDESSAFDRSIANKRHGKMGLWNKG